MRYTKYFNFLERLPGLGPTLGVWRAAARTTKMEVEHEIAFRQWVWSVRAAPQVTFTRPEKCIGLLAAYHAKRTRNLDPLARAFLHCPFISIMIVSNHNPALQIQDWVRVRDPRLVLLNQPTRRGYGYRFELARDVGADYFIIIDDDLLISPNQIAILFEQLLKEPQLPHGLVGILGSQLLASVESQVDCLFQIYAGTRAHALAYWDFAARLAQRGEVQLREIEYHADDVLFSRTGQGKAKIHAAGSLLQCKTTSEPGVASHTSPDFWEPRNRITAALEQFLAPSQYNENGRRYDKGDERR